MIQKPEGTQDLIGQDADLWDNFILSAESTLNCCGYSRIEIPTFEREELFERGIGESTDIVNKEMFSVLSGGNLEKVKTGEDVPSKSKFCLRPEGTAGVVRAIIENGLLDNGGQPAKFWYAGPMFRAERPQKGRLREFHQLGLECLGSEDPFLDAQTIVLMMNFFDSFGIKISKCTLHLNSMGCKECRPKYREELKKFIDAHSYEMCETCLARSEKNPLRSFDCKNEQCKNVMQKAPKIEDFLCEDCKHHFTQVTTLLDFANVKYEEDPTLVRGLDYYSRTVFECTYDDGLGSQNAIGGGGRYDSLVSDLGGKDTPGLGFAVGFERCVLAKKSRDLEEYEPTGPDFFIITLCKEAKDFAQRLMLSKEYSDLFYFDMDFRPPENSSSKFHSLKSQMRLANKLRADAVIIIGEDEIKENHVKIKYLKTGEEKTVSMEMLHDELLSEVFDWNNIEKGDINGKRKEI